MEMPSEILWGGVAAGFGGMGIALRVVYRHGEQTARRIEKALGDRIAALEGELVAARTFERTTLVGLILDATGAASECHRTGRRLSRVIEVLRARYGDEILAQAEDARRRAAEAETDRIDRCQPSRNSSPT